MFSLRSLCFVASFARDSFSRDTRKEPQNSLRIVFFAFVALRCVLCERFFSSRHSQRFVLFAFFDRKGTVESQGTLTISLYGQVQLFTQMVFENIANNLDICFQIHLFQNMRSIRIHSTHTQVQFIGNLGDRFPGTN